MFELQPYTAERQGEWNDFVARSKQGTFLLDRRYMDYHADRFLDHSLMAYRKSRLYALLPANADGTTLHSHQGLTYGGLVTDSKATASEVGELLVLVNERLRGEGFKKVIYKNIPYIYHRLPSDEDLYALFNTCHARLSVRNIASVVAQGEPLKWRRIRECGARKAEEGGIAVEESADLAAFWAVLDANLMRSHGVHPVHTLQEMELLRGRFPRDIRLHVAKDGAEVLAGAVVFATPRVAHVQYISASEEGKERHALDLLFRQLLTVDYRGCRYFDFGTSNEDRGRYLNASLIYQKEGFGGRGVCYDTYEWDL